LNPKQKAELCFESLKIFYSVEFSTFANDFSSKKFSANYKKLAARHAYNKFEWNIS